MCVDNAHSNVSRWIKILKCISSYDVLIQNEVFEKLLDDCKSMNDEEKVRIKNKIRYEIYRNRYFDDAEWSMPEEVLCEFEHTMNRIIVDGKNI